MSARTTGRVIGALFLAQVVLSPAIYFRLLPPGNRASFLETAAAHAAEVRLAILLAMIAGLMTIGAAIAAWPVLRRHSERHAVAYVAVAVVSFAALCMENLVLRQMLAMSSQYTTGGERETLGTLGPVVRESWRQAHFTTLVLGHATGFVLQLGLFRFSLVPRVIPAVGMAAALFAVGNVAAPLMGGTFRFATMAPVAITQLVLIAWLLRRGLRDEPQAA